MQDQLLADLDRFFEDVRIEYNLSKGDMPDVSEFSKYLQKVEGFSVFTYPKKKTIDGLDNLIRYDIPELLKEVGGITGLGYVEGSSCKNGEKFLQRVAGKINGAVKGSKIVARNNNESDK